MAITHIKQLCGHLTEHNLLGPGPERARWEAWLRSVVCNACNHEQARRDAATMATLNDLPELTGEARRVDWAVCIRAGKLADFEALTADYLRTAQQAVAAGKATEEIIAKGLETARAAAAKALQQTDAEWWVARDGWTAREILKEMVGR